jgi:predicted nucleic acid-binding protein
MTFGPIGSDVRVYLDTSALIKRVRAEDHSAELIADLRHRVARGDDLATSSLTWVEVERALRALESAGALPSGLTVDDAAAVALSGIDELPLDARVTRMSRWIGPSTLRTLDAIHLATAVLDGSDVIVTYDNRMAEAAQSVHTESLAPGR